MANPEHVEILKQGVEVWNRWREANKDLLPDLSGTDLSGIDLEEAYLEKAMLDEARLTGTNLHMANLEWADLGQANLQGANLQRANLSKADLSVADLSGAYLKEASLAGTCFVRANLAEADLENAHLYDTDFGNAFLDKTNFNRSIAGGTKFTDVSLERAVGLENIVHLGPSSIGIDTIYKSRGQISEVFLRGCGVPENFIRHMKSLTMNPIDYYSCFISYSHQDKSFAKRLHDQLQAKGIRCWLDDHQILPGDDIYDQVDRGIRMWDKVLLCCSQPSLTSWWVDNEVATAFNKEQQLMRDRKKKVLSLIPLNLDGYMFSDEWTSGKRQQIKERLAADFTGWETDNEKFEEQFERVVKALQTEREREEAPVSRL